MNKLDLREQIKQNLNLSTLALSVVENDMFIFNNPKWDNFINRVFLNFADDADASVSVALQRYKDELVKKLKNNKSVDENGKQTIIQTLLESRKRELKDKSEYGNYFYKKFNMNLDSKKYWNSSADREFYKSPGTYFKSVIEEYSRLPFVERERIYFKNYVEEINYAVNNHCRLKVETDKGAVFDVFPYKIAENSFSTANYLVGYSIPLNSNIDKTICSFRISKIKTIKRTGLKNDLNADDIQDIKNKIKKRGVEFLIGETNIIKVKLTEKGINQYNRSLNLRPTYIEKSEDNVFTFNCTLKQAEFYFFKFGENAEIISPSELRDIFKEKYEKAMDIYK